MASTTTITSALRTAGGSPSASTRSDSSTTPRSRARHPIRQGTLLTHRHASGAAVLPAHLRRPRRQSRPVSRTTPPPAGSSETMSRSSSSATDTPRWVSSTRTSGGPVMEQLPRIAADLRTLSSNPRRRPATTQPHRADARGRNGRLNEHSLGPDGPKRAANPGLGWIALSAATSGHPVRSCSARLLRRPALVRRHPQDWLTPAS